MALQAFLVDDEPHALNMLELFLLRTGEVEIVGRSINGFEALEAMKHTRPDIWFLDIEMPGMSGLELAAHIHELEPDASVVFVTAYDHYAVSAFEQEALDYLLKPVEMSRLSRTIERILKEKNAMSLSPRPPLPAPVEAEKEMLTVLSVSMFGKFHVSSTNGETVMWRTAKEKELFAYLLLHNPATSDVHRDHIIEHLWPSEQYEKAKVYMHTCVSLLRKNLRKLGIEDAIRYKNGHYLLNRRQIRADVHELIELFGRIQHEEDIPLARMEEVLALYQDTLLSQEDYPWMSEWSRQLERSALEFMLLLSLRYLDQRDAKRAAELAERAIRHSPYEEEGYRCAMQAYLAMGNPHHVQRIYQALESQLEELNIRPSEMAVQLYEQIRV